MKYRYIFTLVLLIITTTSGYTHKRKLLKKLKKKGREAAEKVKEEVEEYIFEETPSTDQDTLQQRADVPNTTQNTPQEAEVTKNNTPFQTPQNTNWIGKDFPNIDMPTLDNKTMNTHEFFSQKRYNIVVSGFGCGHDNIALIQLSENYRELDLKYNIGIAYVFVKRPDRAVEEQQILIKNKHRNPILNITY